MTGGLNHCNDEKSTSVARMLGEVKERLNHRNDEKSPSVAQMLGEVKEPLQTRV
jgi:hypothetical protein